MSAALLTKEQERRLAEKLGDKTTVFASSVARLYYASDGKWKYTGIYGIIALVLDRETKVRTIRIYNAETLVPRFQAEIPVNPSYVVESEYFHALELDNEVVGFLFAVGRENATQQDKNATLTSEARRFANKVTQMSLKTDDDDLKAAKEKAKLNNISDSGPKRKGSIAAGWSKVKSTAKILLGSGSNPAPAAMVGMPTDVQHVGHIGLNKDGTMNIGNVPEEWKEILKMAGITKRDMKNPEVNKTVVNMLGTLVPAAAKSSPGPKAPPKKMKAVYDYTSSSSKELSISEGETLAMLKAYPDGWARVQKVDGQTGMVPLNYLEDTGMLADAVIPNRDSPNSPVRKSTTAPPPRTSAPPRAPPAASATPSSAPPAAAAAVASPPARSPAVGRAPPPRPSPPLAGGASPQKRVVINTAPVQHTVESTEEPAAEEPAAEVPAAEEEAPRPKNPLLASIQGFSKDALNKTESDEEDRPAKPPMNPLLAGIQGFNKDALNKADTPKSGGGGGGAGGANPLDAIKAGNFQLKKVEKSEAAPEVPKQMAQPEMEGIAGLLKAKLANIRLGVKEEDDDDDDAGSDWD